jgi:NAD(P)-dependent dehydrogenase (short-subunit alcohol dehydrogenase family)
MRLGLEGRVVMLSGAAAGMGGGIIEALLEAGAKLSLTDRPGPALDGLADRASADVLVVASDLATVAGASSWAESTLERFGQIDALVSVAGAWQIREFLDVTEEDLDLMLAANLKTAFNAAQAVTPHMKERGQGSIVSFASTAGEYGSISPAAHYAAAKAAVIGMTKSLARELSPLGIRVNAISPGPIDTAALAGGRAIDRERVAQRTLLGRLGTPEDIAGAVLYLIGDGSTFVTGHVLGVNGGSLL